jgi:hypothetical protein
MLSKMCWLRRGVRWILTCASKCLAIMFFFFFKSVLVISEPPCTYIHTRNCKNCELCVWLHWHWLNNDHHLHPHSLH